MLPLGTTETTVMLDRYRDIVDDWDRFWEASHAPEPVSFRVRRGLVQASDLIARLESAGFRTERVSDVDGYFRVTAGPESVSQTIEHWMGFFHVQQAVMGLPSLALAPRPGDRVLDLCAAPGGKTAHMAELMGEDGPLVAVDPKEKRIRGLLGNIYRMGYTNVIVVAADGRQLPLSAQFDRVLVDAPCSGEGNYRRQEGRTTTRSARFSTYVTDLQESLLRRAIELTRPGGTIVYSTCTYAPEENEAILDRVLRDAPVTIEHIPLRVPHQAGIAEWHGACFDPTVVRAWRVYPHHLDSGGLFMARLRRAESNGLGSDEDASKPESAGGWTPIPCTFPGEDPLAADMRIESAKRELEHRFQFSPTLLDQLGWMVRGKHIWAHTAKDWPVPEWAESRGRHRRTISVGLRALRAEPRGRETPSSHFLSRWGAEIAGARRVELDCSELRRLLEGGSLPPGSLPAGPVAIVWDGRVLGRGMIGSRGFMHELGRSYAERLLRVLPRATSG